MPATVQRGNRRKGQGKNEGLREYFDRLLTEKQVRVEDVAHDLKRSFSTVWSWKTGRSKPDFVVKKCLELEYGIKVA